MIQNINDASEISEWEDSEPTEGDGGTWELWEDEEWCNSSFSNCSGQSMGWIVQLTCYCEACVPIPDLEKTVALPIDFEVAASYLPNNGEACFA